VLKDTCFKSKFSPMSGSVVGKNWRYFFIKTMAGLLATVSSRLLFVPQCGKFRLQPSGHGIIRVFSQTGDSLVKVGDGRFCLPFSCIQLTPCPEYWPTSLMLPRFRHLHCSQVLVHKTDHVGPLSDSRSHPAYRSLAYIPSRKNSGNIGFQQIRIAP